MSRKLVRQLSEYDLKMAAFHLAMEVDSHPHAYKPGMAEAIAVFLRLPCPETAANLVYVWPGMLSVFQSTVEASAVHAPGHVPGPDHQAYQGWIDQLEANLRNASEIQAFLRDEVACGRVTVDARAADKHAAVYTRLHRIGLKKGIFSSPRGFLTTAVTQQLSAFRAVADLVCIQGDQDGAKRCWNGLGARTDSRSTPEAELVYDLGRSVGAFVDLVQKLTAPGPDS